MTEHCAWRGKRLCLVNEGMIKFHGYHIYGLLLLVCAGGRFFGESGIDIHLNPAQSGGWHTSIRKDGLGRCQHLTLRVQIQGANNLLLLGLEQGECPVHTVVCGVLSRQMVQGALFICGKVEYLGFSNLRFLCISGQFHI